MRTMKEYGLTTSMMHTEPVKKATYNIKRISTFIKTWKKINFPVKTIPTFVMRHCEISFRRGNPYHFKDSKHYIYIRKQLEYFENERKKRGWPKIIYHIGGEYPGNLGRYKESLGLDWKEYATRQINEISKNSILKKKKKPGLNRYACTA